MNDNDYKCGRCGGCGKLAGAADQEPWSAWLARNAHLLDMVKAVECPDCHGTGMRVQPAAEPVDWQSIEARALKLFRGSRGEDLYLWPQIQLCSEIRRIWSSVSRATSVVVDCVRDLEAMAEAQEKESNRLKREMPNMPELEMVSRAKAVAYHTAAAACRHRLPL